MRCSPAWDIGDQLDGGEEGSHKGSWLIVGNQSISQVRRASSHEGSLAWGILSLRQGESMSILERQE